MKTCPECFTQVPDQALVCHACTRRIEGKACLKCAEISKHEARVCQYCGHDFAREQTNATIKPFSVKGDMLATVLLRGRFIPQEIVITTEKIVIKTWGSFGLSRTDEDIPWEKIAGYHYRSGMFWDGIEIQTRGQKSNSMGCLNKAQGQKIKEALERMKE